MKKYNGKTEQDVVKLACQDLGVTLDELNYTIISQTKTLFSKKIEIECYTISMVQEFIENYIRLFLSDMEFEVETISYLQNDRIYCNINSSNNSILIGKAGIILRAINFIVKNAVSSKFKKRIEVSVDINGYKEDRYKKVTSMAKRIGKSIQRTKIEVILDPMPADERKVMHQVISEMRNLKTQSVGEGKQRHMVITYKD